MGGGKIEANKIIISKREIMKKLVLASLVGLGLVFSGCGEDSTPNSVPVVTQGSVVKSVMEGSFFSYDLTSNVTDADDDNLSVASISMLDGTKFVLPTGVSIVGNELVVSDAIEIADGLSESYDFNVTVSDGVDSVSYALNLVLQDAKSDSLLTYELTLPSSISSDSSLYMRLAMSDADGLSTNELSYEILDKGNEGSVIYSGSLADSVGDGNYTGSFDLSSNSIVPGSYTFSMVISPVVGGEDAQGDVNVSRDFEVFSVNYAPTGESFSVDASQNDTYTVDLASHINDADGDSLTVNFVESGVVSGDIVIDDANTGISGTNATITVTDGTGTGYIDYTVSDGTTTSATYRITFTGLDGE
jgi:hypothetical protein